MTSIKKTLEAEIKTLPRLFLGEALKKKLDDLGVRDKRAIEAFVEHLLSGEVAPFKWDDGDERASTEVKLEFSEQESDDILSSMKHFLERDFPKVLEDVITHSAKDLVKTLYTGWPERKLDDRHETKRFSDRIDLRWSKGLDPLRMMLFASREIGDVYAEKLRKSKAKKGILKRQALMILHVRACKITLEILTLIENGLADGAYARWRTLYEITVVAFFINRHGDEAAKRYLAHYMVSAREELKNEITFTGHEYDPKMLRGGARKIEEDFQNAVLEFGKSFASSYGWASDSLGLKSPRFQDLEKAVDWGSLPPAYKWSSFMIHAGSAGSFRTVAAICGDRFVHAGATNAGLQIPSINTAFSLLQITSLIFPNPHQIETAIQMKSLILLRDSVVKECEKAAQKLENDEYQIRLANEA